MNRFVYIIILSLFLLQGCDSGSGENMNVDITTTAAKKSDLQTLASLPKDLRKVLREERWKAITCDLKRLDSESWDMPGIRRYSIDMRFGEREVVAYADCQRLTARYRVEGKKLSFSQSRIAPAIDLASCKEFEYADDAVWAFFENSYTLRSADEEALIFDAQEVETTVTLHR